MRKILLIFFALILTLQIVPSGAYELNTLSDINEHWAEAEMQTLYDINILNGSNNMANPDDTITRGEFTALTTRMIYDMNSYKGKAYFNDVPSGDVFFDNVSVAYENGIINGKREGYFDRNGNITREEMVIIISRVLNDKEITGNISFTDIKKDYTYLSYLQKVAGMGIINGYADGSFKPYSNATRAEASAILLRLLKVMGNAPSKAELSGFNGYEIDEKFLMGTALSEEDYKKEIRSLMKKYSLSVSKKHQLVSSNIEFLGNNLAFIEQKFGADYTIDYKSETKQKDYTLYRSLYLYRKDGVWKVYRAEERLSLEKDINLTWEVFNTVPSYAPEGVNVVSPTWFELNSGGDYKYSPAVYEKDGVTINLSDNATSAYLDYARENDYDVWAMYRTDFKTATANKFLYDESARNKAIVHLVDRVSRYALDGINMDFENMYHTDASAYANHVREVTLAMHEIGIVTSVDVSKYDKTSKTWSMCFDRDALAKSTDYLCLMAYDQYSVGSNTAGPVAGLNWVEGCITSLLKEADSEQIILGVPFYVRLWKTKDGKVVSTKAISMDEAGKLAYENNATYSYSESDGQNIVSWTDGGYLYQMWMENAESINKKASFKEKYALSGIASWRRGFETIDVWGVIDKYIN